MHTLPQLKRFSLALVLSLFVVVASIDAVAKAKGSSPPKHGKPTPAAPAPMGQGGTIWLNCKGDNTGTWWGMHPNVTPPADLSLADQAKLVTMLQDAFDGVGDTDDGKVWPAIKITFVLDPVPLQMGKSFEAVIGGTGAWTGGVYGGYGDEGGAWFSPTYWAASQGKYWVFSANVGNDLGAIKVLTIHEFLHAMGFTDAGAANLGGDYYLSSAGLGGTKFTAAQWQMISNTLGTK